MLDAVLSSDFEIGLVFEVPEEEAGELLVDAGAASTTAMDRVEHEEYDTVDVLKRVVEGLEEYVRVWIGGFDMRMKPERVRPGPSAPCSS